MATLTIDSARLKLSRAEELINEIRADYDRLNLTQKPVPDFIAMEEEIGPEGPWTVARCAEPPTLPLRWGLLAGDAMHNTRTALDHLACRLVEHDGGSVGRRTAFPIWPDPPANSDERRRFEKPLDGMSEDHKAAIRRLQPYAHADMPGAGLLTALAALDNLDKHTAIVPLAAVLSKPHLRAPAFVSPTAQEIEYRWNAGALLAPDVEILRFRGKGGGHSITDVHVGVGVRATYGDPSIGLRELREIRAHVVGIIESFAVEPR